VRERARQPTTPSLAAAYGVRFGSGCLPVTEPIVTILPARALQVGQRGLAGEEDACEVDGDRLVPLLQADLPERRRGAAIPALLTRISNVPRSPAALAISASRWAGSVTSPAKQSAVAAGLANLSADELQRLRPAPRQHDVRAVGRKALGDRRPDPWPAPVTTAVVPAKS